MLNFHKNLAIIKANHRIVLLLSVTIISCHCGAQDIELGSAKGSPDVYILPAHTHVNQVSWRDSVYAFPNFHPGKITFHNGYSPKESMPLNYNLYLGQMAMINYDGDTVQLQHSKEIKLAVVGDQIFFHDSKIGFIQIIQQLPVALVVHRTMTIHTAHVHGSKDGTSYGSDVRGTPATHTRYYKKEERYYIISKENKAYKATRASILKLFNSKDEINSYLARNAPDFENRSDLLQLMLFCNEADSKGKN